MSLVLKYYFLKQAEREQMEKALFELGMEIETVLSFDDREIQSLYQDLIQDPSKEKR